MDDVFKALADASRRKLLDVLHSNNGQTLTELCEHLAMTRQAVTKHLKLLEEANLIVVVWRGSPVFVSHRTAAEIDAARKVNDQVILVHYNVTGSNGKST